MSAELVVVTCAAVAPSRPPSMEVLILHVVALDDIALLPYSLIGVRVRIERRVQATQALMPLLISSL